MNIGIIIIHPFSESLGTIHAILNSAKELVKTGTNIYIFTPYEKDHIMDQGLYCYNINIKYFTKRSYKFLKFFYKIPYIHKIINSNSIIKYVSSENLYNSIVSTINNKKIKLDIIQSEGLITLKVCIRIAKKFKIPSVLRVHNLGMEEYADIGIFKRNDPFYIKNKKSHYELLNKTDGIITLTKYAKMYLKNNYSLTNTIIEHIPIGTHNKIRSSETKLKKPYKIVYSGSFEKHENIDLLINSVKYLKCIKDIHIIFTGKGSQIKKYKDQCKNIKIPTKFIWFNNYEDYLDFLSTCYIGIIPWSNSTSRRIGFPMKLLDYLSVGLPIISTRVKGWTQIIEQENIGLLSGFEPEELANNIKILVESPEMIEIFSKNINNVINNNFNWKTISKNTLNFYNKICQN
jgi:glycosyltransferase involved in cell wall biosynthesis